MKTVLSGSLGTGFAFISPHPAAGAGRRIGADIGAEMGGNTFQVRRIDDMLQWIQANEAIRWWLAATSAVIFFGTMMAVPWIVVRLPSNYFIRRKRHSALWSEWSSWMRRRAERDLLMLRE